MSIVTLRARLLFAATLSLAGLLPSACSASRVAHPPAPWVRQNDLLTVSRQPTPTGSGVDVEFVRWLSPGEIDALPDDVAGLVFALDAIAGSGARVQLQVNGVDGHALPPKAQIRAIRIIRRALGGADASVTIINILTQ
jgi:hypothetical protein